jgi:4'-phosphopantetheinyl transferase
MGDAPSVSFADRVAAESGLEIWCADLIAGRELLWDVARSHGLASTIPESDGTDASRQVAHAALRIVLAGHIGLAEARRPFRAAPGGKPALVGPLNRPLDFSLAHCATAALIAISRDGPVGVDLEAPRPIRIAEARRIALIDAATSLAPGAALPDGPGDAGLLQAWTRLEALAKATGEGIGALLERLRRGATQVAEVTLASRALHVCDVTVRDASPYFAAVAGMSPSLATGSALEAASLPLDRRWLEQWLTGGTDHRALPARPSPRD